MRPTMVMLFILIPLLLTAGVLRVAHEGQPYTQIQRAINAAAAGDTVLVYPGTYYENLVLSGRTLTLTSLFAGGADSTYIYTTILDGNHLSSVIRIQDNSAVTINGFTITHGSGYDIYGDLSNVPGGGIYGIDSDIQLLNNLIQANFAMFGGGLDFEYGNIHLAGNVIRYNSTMSFSAGLGISNASCVFSVNNLNSVYLNYSSRYSDMLLSQVEIESIHFKYFTAEDTSFSHVLILDCGEVPLVFDYTVITPVEADLYVAPWGDNTNSGLTAASPLKNVNYAITLVKGDSLHIRTIHLAAGTYKVSEGQTLPMIARSYVRLQGEGPGNTIIDGEGMYSQLMSVCPMLEELPMFYDFTCQGMSMINARGLPRDRGGSVWLSVQGVSNFTLKDMVFDNRMNAYGQDCGFSSFYNADYQIENVRAYNPNKHSTLLGVGSWGNTLLKNIYLSTGMNGLFMVFDSAYPPSHFKVYNVMINNCYNNGTGSGNNLVASALRVDGVPWEYWDDGTQIDMNDYTADFVNCSFINSNNYYRGMVGVQYKCRTGFYNCLFYNRDIATRMFVNSRYRGAISFDHCFFPDGMDDFSNYSSLYEVSTNAIFSGDPLIDYDMDQPYTFEASSPLINAGTANLPDGLNLPETDVWGNPRVVDGQVDIGAMEYQGVPTDDEYTPPAPESMLIAYPNPSSLGKLGRGNTIKFSLDVQKAGRVCAKIYNIRGQLVYTLMDAKSSVGQFDIRWNGRDETGHSVPSGTYLCRLEAPDKTSTQKFVILE